MPSIQDRHTRGFNELTDWFSWGIVTFQVYTGIHPYKGSLSGFGRYDLDARMQANASVFRPEVRLNKAVRPWNTIPGILLDWYVAVFEQGERTVPPSPFDTGVGHIRPARTLRMVTTAQGALRYTKLFERLGDPVVRVFPSGVVRLRSGALVNAQTGKDLIANTTPTVEVVSVQGGWLMGDRDHTGFSFTYVDEQTGVVQQVPLPLSGYRLVTGDERLFAVTDRGLSEIVLTKVGTGVFATNGKTWGLSPHALTWHRGIGVWDALGARYLMVPCGGKGVAQIRVRELDDLRVVAGVCEGRLASLVAVDKAGAYQRLDLVLDRTMTAYTVASTPTSTAELNMTVLLKGVTARIEDDGELTITVPTTGTVNNVADKDIATDMLLARIGDGVVYVKDGSLWSLRMK
jgi:hypothetical protein